jgi:hypothetical protein
MAMPMAPPIIRPITPKRAVIALRSNAVRKNPILTFPRVVKQLIMQVYG